MSTNPRQTEEQTLRGEAGGPEPPPFREHNIIATYPDTEAARPALTGLERAGIEAGDISLLGPGAEVASPVTNEEQREADMATTGEVGKRAAVGGAAGTAAGAAVGAGLATAAAFVVPGLGVLVGGGIIGAAVGGGAAGGALGVFYGGATGLPVNNEAWGLTYETVKAGQALVAVHSDDPAVVDRAMAVLRDTEPLRLSVFNSDGRLSEVH